MKIPNTNEVVRPQKIDDNTKINALLAFEENPITPARQVARENLISNTSLLKILKNQNIRPYKMQIHQELLEDDRDRRIEFCERTMNDVHQLEIYMDWILFTDESTFTLDLPNFQEIEKKDKGLMYGHKKMNTIQASSSKFWSVLYEDGQEFTTCILRMDMNVISK
ncbi:hypothetical protein ABEB36_015242 [Hypothenemus hampei]|uniref:Transposase n=1 Tax=Hypothenemus hampei TaxID=57062 RepID=A0ABD1E150_HYPHA